MGFAKNTALHRNRGSTYYQVVLMKNAFPTSMLKFWILALLADLHCCAQGTFQNLSFENPIPPLIPSGTAIERAMPGWAAYLDTEPVGLVFINGISLGGAAVSLRDLNSTTVLPLIGSYSADLFNGLPFGSGGDGRIASLGQTGTIPANSVSLRFVATSLSPVVTFGGTPLA